VSLILHPDASTPADRNPAACYLAALLPSGRRSQGIALRTAARVLAPLVHVERFPWALLRYQHVDHLRAVLVDDGYAPATVNKTLAAVKGSLRQAWLLGQIPVEDYHRALEVPSASGSRLPPGRALSKEEVRLLLASAAPRDAAAIALLWGAGLRAAEACSATRGSVDLDVGEVRVIGKGNKERLVPIGAGALPVLRSWGRADRRLRSQSVPALASRLRAPVAPEHAGNARRLRRRAGLA
jgi:site-specific recombinase XerC